MDDGDPRGRERWVVGGGCGYGCGCAAEIRPEGVAVILYCVLGTVVQDRTVPRYVSMCMYCMYIPPTGVGMVLYTVLCSTVKTKVKGHVPIMGTVRVSVGSCSSDGYPHPLPLSQSPAPAAPAPWRRGDDDASGSMRSWLRNLLYVYIQYILTVCTYVSVYTVCTYRYTVHTVCCTAVVFP